MACGCGVGGKCLSLVLSLARVRDVEDSAEHWSMHVKVAIGFFFRAPTSALSVASVEALRSGVGVSRAVKSALLARRWNRWSHKK